MATLWPQLFVILAGSPRAFGLVAVAPGFSTNSVPPLVRVMLALGLSVALAPLVSGDGKALLALRPEAYLALLVTELVLGAIMGYVLSCLLEAARLAGEIVDFQIGFQAGAMYDPVTSGSSSVIGRFWSLAALVFFFVVDGHHWLLGGLMRSYECCPVGEIILQPQLAGVILDVLQAVFTLAVQIAAPVVAALILADLTLGLVGRSMPQMNLMLVGMPAKILIGLATLALCSPMLAGSFVRVVELLRQYLPAVLKLAGG
ncbi:MAG: flagellar biosynthetic protein FliR [Armatimonadota bacterium]